jgi:hypothetical protein
MKVAIANFRGEVPRLSPQALPVNASREAVNCRLLSADLEAWKNFELAEALCKTPPVVTIYQMDDQYWLQWTQSELGSGAFQVDVARSTIAGDTTFRVFLTGLDVPRYTNLSLTTGGSGCFPRATRVLGVINPVTAPTTTSATGGTPAINVTDDGTQYASWSPVGTVSGGGVERYAVQDTITGNPAPSYYFVALNTPVNAYMLRDFGVGGAVNILMQSDIQIAQANIAGAYSGGIRIGTDSSGTGPAFTVYSTGGGNCFIALSQAVGVTGDSVLASAAVTPIGIGSWFKLKLQVTRNADGSASLVGTLLQNDGVTVIGTISATGQINGGFGMLSTANTTSTQATIVRFDNIIVQASGAFNDPTDDFNTNYVYTFVNSIGEESGPSEPSETIVKDNGTTVTITTPTSAPTGYDYDVQTKRIYRAVTEAGTTVYKFVAEIALATATYDDTLTNAQLGETLTTDGYELPPTDLRSIIALPNNIYAGISGNQLCLSAQGAPHAWPVANRYATDFPPVRLGAIDATVVIATEGFPYLASGNDPSVFSMNKLEVPQGCVSYRSLAYLKGTGVIYASADGLIAVAGTGQVVNLTAALFSRKEWQQLNPETMIGAVQDDRYFGFYIDEGGLKRGLMIEATADGFGKVTLNFHATAVYSDTVNDKLFLVLDENDVPSIGSAGGQYAVDGGDIYAFDAYEGGTPGGYTLLLPQSWLSKKFLMPYPNCFRYCTVKAQSYDDLYVEFLANGVVYYGRSVTSEDAFVLPDIADDGTAKFFSVKIYGTSFVESIQVADDVDEFE